MLGLYNKPTEYVAVSAILTWCFIRDNALFFSYPRTFLYVILLISMRFIIIRHIDFGLAVLTLLRKERIWSDRDGFLILCW